MAPTALSVAACLALVLVAQVQFASAAVVVPVGGLFPLSPPRTNAGMQRQKATELALAAINADTAVLPGITLSLVSEDTRANPEAGASGMFALASTHKVPAAVGAASSSVSMAASLVGRIFNVPLVSYSSTSASLSNKEVYPLFARTVPVDSLQAEALIALVKQFGWKQVSLMGGDTAYASGMLNDVESVAEKAEVVITKRVTHPVQATAADLTQYVTELDSRLSTLATGDARIVILADLDADAINIVARAREKGMIGPGTGWTWVGVDGWLQSSVFGTTAVCDSACAAANLDALKGVIGTAPRLNSAALAAWKTNTWDPNVGPGQLTPAQKAGSNLTTWAGDNLNSFAPFAYDAGLAVSQAMHALCFQPTEGGLAAVPNATMCYRRLVDENHGATLYAELMKVDVQGATGRVQFASSGDRPLDYQVLNINNAGEIKEVGYWVAATNDVNSTAAGCVGDFSACSGIYWPGGGGVPSDGFEVQCGIGEEKASSTTGKEFCVTCRVGQYNLEANAECKDCPKGAKCEGGAHIAADVGYWQLQHGLPQQSNTALIDRDAITFSGDFFRCRSAPYACCPDEKGCFANKSAPTGLTNLCGPRREGVLCSWCSAGYTLWAGECIPCEGTNAGLVVLIVIVVALVIVVLVVRPPGKSGAGLIVIDYYQLTNIIAVPKTSSGSSVFAYMALLFNLTPNDVGSACPAKLSPLEGAALGYFIPSLMVAELLFFLVVTKLVFYIRARRAKKRDSSSDPVARGAGASAKRSGTSMSPLDSRRRALSAQRFRASSRTSIRSLNGASAKRRHVSTRGVRPTVTQRLETTTNQKFLIAFWRVIFFIYAGASTTALSLLNCRTVGEYHILESHPNVFCWDSAHTAIAALSFPVFLCLTLGVPVYIAVRFRLTRARWRRHFRRLILKRRREAQLKHAQLADLSTGADGEGPKEMEVADEKRVVKVGTKFIKRILPSRGHMRDANMYRAGIRQWFPSVFFFRRAVMIMFAVFLADDGVWRQIVLFVLCLALLGLQLMFRPFRDPVDDSVATVSMIALLLVAGVQLYAAAVQASPTLEDLHHSTGRDDFQLAMDVVLLLTPALWLVKVNAGKVMRSVQKRREAGFLCFKPKISKAMRAELAKQDAVREQYEIELKAGSTRTPASGTAAGGATGASATPPRARMANSKLRKGSVSMRRTNPVAFTDLRAGDL